MYLGKTHSTPSNMLGVVFLLFISYATLVDALPQRTVPRVYQLPQTSTPSSLSSSGSTFKTEQNLKNMIRLLHNLNLNKSMMPTMMAAIQARSREMTRSQLPSGTSQPSGTFQPITGPETPSNLPGQLSTNIGLPTQSIFPGMSIDIVKTSTTPSCNEPLRIQIIKGYFGL